MHWIERKGFAIHTAAHVSCVCMYHVCACVTHVYMTSCVFVYVSMPVCVCDIMCTCVRVCVCVCVCMSVCMGIHLRAYIRICVVCHVY